MINTPYNIAVTISKSDTVNIVGPKPLTDAIYAGGAGTMTVVLQDDTTVQFTMVAGGLIPIAAKRVNSTGTAATAMTALYCA